MYNFTQLDAVPSKKTIQLKTTNIEMPRFCCSTVTDHTIKYNKIK